MSDAVLASGYRGLLPLPVPRRLAMASIPADFVDWLDYAAIIALLVFAWGEGPFVLALFAFCLTLPHVAVVPASHWLTPGDRREPAPAARSASDLALTLNA